MSSTSSFNPNYWLCKCAGTAGVKTVFDLKCPVCQQMFPMPNPGVSQQLINAQAEEMVSALKLNSAETTRRRSGDHLPSQKVKPPPTREEFEEALDWLEKDAVSAAEWKARGWYSHPQQLPSPREKYQMIVKRYKHYYHTH